MICRKQDEQPGTESDFIILIRAREMKRKVQV